MGNQVFHPKNPKWFDSKVLTKFSQAEIRLIKATFKDLALRSPGKTIDRNTFLTHFPLPGLHGEQLFDIFDNNHSGVIDFEEFITGIAIACKGSFEERFELVFRIYDITKDGYISPDELRTMLYHVPVEALALWHNKKYLSNTTSEVAGEEQSSIDSSAVDSLNKPTESVLIPKIKEVDLHGNGHMDEAQKEQIITKLVQDAYGENNVSEDTKLSFDKFKEWVCKNPEVMILFNTVFSSFQSKSNSPVDSPYCAASAFTPPARSLTPPPSFKHFGFLMRSNSLAHKEKNQKNFAARSSSSSHFDDPLLAGAGMKKNNSYSSNLFELGSTGSGNGGDSETDSHTCIKAGQLMKVGRRSKRKQNRYYKLYGNILYYYSNERSNTPSGVIMMSGCFVDPVENSEGKYYALKIVTGKGGQRDERQLLSKSAAERDDWVKVLRKASRDRKFTTKYVLKHKIGTGKFSNVYMCKSRATGQERAVKLIKKDHLTEDEKELLRTEVAILRLVEHPYIVRLIDVFETVENMYLVMELLKGGELYHCIVGRPRFSSDEAYVLLKQLTEAIHYLHDAGIVHRDMKPENVLLSKPIPKGSRLDSSFQIKLADFGLSKLVAPNEVMNLPCGTISYVAPEVLSQKGYGKEADLWSVGVILYLVVRGKLPFNSEDKDAIIKEILNNELNFVDDPVFSKLDPGLCEIIASLLNRDAKKRMSSKEVLAHWWMKKMDAREEEKKLKKSSTDTEQVQAVKPEPVPESVAA